MNARKDFGVGDYIMDWLGSGWEYETQEDLDKVRGELDYLVGAKAQMLNTDAVKEEVRTTNERTLTNEQKQKVQIEFQGLPEWLKATIQGGGNMVKPSVTSTM